MISFIISVVILFREDYFTEKYGFDYLRSIQLVLGLLEVIELFVESLIFIGLSRLLKWR